MPIITRVIITLTGSTVARGNYEVPKIKDNHYKEVRDEKAEEKKYMRFQK
jgi:hypothetical protein